MQKLTERQRELLCSLVPEIRHGNLEVISFSRVDDHVLGVFEMQKWNPGYRTDWQKCWQQALWSDVLALVTIGYLMPMPGETSYRLNSSRILGVCQ
jgi:hypothetical protein